MEKKQNIQMGGLSKDETRRWIGLNVRGKGTKIGFESLDGGVGGVRRRG